jgi:hypothetical protein
MVIATPRIGLLGRLPYDLADSRPSNFAKAGHVALCAARASAGAAVTDSHRPRRHAFYFRSAVAGSGSR